ncbi:7852_t:CDS:2 [Ambispora gerdemannii]|uniref:7852_t:CDS:1 n=1 Tax=Ambispora gerdemannii TaxID=144530 RepID=A0A9N9BC54_9GLOM|nr:7852_t:CDS:2 [Ambispora gerdemannii]
MPKVTDIDPNLNDIYETDTESQSDDKLKLPLYYENRFGSTALSLKFSSPIWPNLRTNFEDLYCAGEYFIAINVISQFHQARSLISSIFSQTASRSFNESSIKSQYFVMANLCSHR